MHHYRVVHSGAVPPHVALRDRQGYFHLARCLGAVPPLDLILGGDRPHLGFGILFHIESEELFRVIFERINNREVESFLAVTVTG